MSSALVVIGSSCGGHRTLAAVFADVPRLDASVILVQHMPAFVNRSLRDRLRSLCALDVEVAQGGEALEAGRILIAPSDTHLAIGGDDRVSLRNGDKVCFARPAVDVAMRSVAAVNGRTVTGIVLTGMGTDGARGLAHIKGIGGTTIVQSPATCVIDGMPTAALDTGCVDLSLSPEEIRSHLIDHVG